MKKFICSIRLIHYLYLERRLRKITLKKQKLLKKCFTIYRELGVDIPFEVDCYGK